MTMFQETAWSRTALWFPRAQVNPGGEVSVPPEISQKSCRPLSAADRELCNGWAYPSLPPDPAQFKSPTKMVFSSGCLATQSCTYFHITSLSVMFSAVNWYIFMMFNLPPSLVIVDITCSLPTEIGWRLRLGPSAVPGCRVKPFAEGKKCESRAVSVVKL